MKPLPAFPSLYEIDARAWLVALGREQGSGVPLTLDQIPEVEIDRLAELGFDWVWMLGVWETGGAGRAASLAHPEWLAAYREILPDFQTDDVAGSMFAIRSYEVAHRFGGGEALARFREKLHARGVRLMLDFVPNHTAPDHAWVREHPDYYIGGTDDDLAREPQNYARVEGGRVLAFGRDPYFPGWPDTFQLNYRHPKLREAMTAELVRAAGRCDGLRCDMAMLLLPDVFRSTWGDRARPADGTPPDDSPFWPAAIARVRRECTETFFLAEAYWDLESRLLEQGFDSAYDKRLYDRLRDRDAPAVRAHLGADLAFLRRCARFLENHDEDRAAAIFPADVHRAAAVVTYLTPGLRFFHQGQLEGRRVRPSVHLSRRPDDPTDPDLIRFYKTLLDLITLNVLKDGSWRLLAASEAWQGNPTWDRLIGFSWVGPSDERFLIAVNFGPTQAQAYLDVLGSEGPIRFRDLAGPTVYDRDVSGGRLYLDMGPWSYHAFRVEPVPAGGGQGTASTAASNGARALSTG